MPKNKMMKLFFAFMLCLLPILVISAQEDPTAQEEPAQEEHELPLSYRAYKLGMGLDELKSALETDSFFVFRGDRDVSFLPQSGQNLVESEGADYIKRAFFQLKDEALFIMAFAMNTRMIDHYSIYTTFVAKYGQPQTLNPKEAVWENEDVRISLERPLTIKYIDKKIFSGLLEDSRVVKSLSSDLREKFLEDF